MANAEWKSDHLPFAMPERRWSLRQNWINLTFLHWEVDPEKIKPYIPDGLELDTFQGRAYVGTIPLLWKRYDLIFYLICHSYLPFQNSMSVHMLRKMVKQEFYF